MSQSVEASTARTEPLLMAITSNSPASISTTVCTTDPASNTRAAPWVRLVRPEATAASWSARSCGKPSENASGRPSADTTIACATAGTRSTKLVMSQFRSCAEEVSELTDPPLCMASGMTAIVVARIGLGRALAGTVRVAVAALVVGRDGARVPDALLETREAFSGLGGGPWRSLLRHNRHDDAAGHQVRLGHPPGQPGPRLAPGDRGLRHL